MNRMQKARSHLLFTIPATIGMLLLLAPQSLRSAERGSADSPEASRRSPAWGDLGERQDAMTHPLTLPASLQSSLLASLPTSLQSSTPIAELIEQGKEFYQAGQLAAAIATWQKAHQLYHTTGDILNATLSLSYLALAHQQLGQWPEANKTMQRAIATLENTHSNPTLASSTEFQLIRAQVLNTQGRLQFAQGQMEIALATWQQAGTIYGQVGTESQRVGNWINQAQAQQGLGLFLRARQTLTQVEQHLQSQPDLQLKTMALRSLGNSLILIGQSAAAQGALQQSLAIAERLSLSEETSATLLSLGNVARVQGDQAAAIAFYQQAAQLTISPVVQLQAQINQLSLLIQMQRMTEAQSLVATIHPQLERVPASRATVQARINLAQSLIKLPSKLPIQSSDQSLPSAAPILATAVQQAQSLGDRPSESQALGYLGNLYEQTHQWSAAKQLTQQALALAQAVNAPEIAYQWQWQLGRILKAEGNLTASLQAYESAFKTLQSVRGDLSATNPEVQFSFRERVEPVYRELVDLLLQDAPATEVQTNLKQAREVIEALRLAELDDFFRTACLEGQSVAIEAVQQTQAAVIYPIILANRLEVIVSLPGQPLRRHATAIPQAQVEATLDQWRQELEKPLTTPDSKRLGQQVYDWLIRPVAAELNQQSVNTLVFVLDGSLRNAPMAALYDGQQYLIERHSIALTPGLRLLKPQPLQQQGLTTLAAGLTQERHGFSALANVGLELQEIQTEVASRLLLNQQFTSVTLPAQLQTRSFPIVHLATHGQFSSKAEETFILAWDKPIKVNELSALLRHQEQTGEKGIELLVLSACETASGDNRAALGLAGVAVQAGARSTLASLWSLDDESGARFMGRFYRELASAKGSKAEALRQAQLVLLRDRNFRHPRYWAPYVLVGNWL